MNRRTLPPLPTYSECIASCQHNIDAAIERARYAEGAVKQQALDDARHWRQMRVWYEAQVAAGRGHRTIEIFGWRPSITDAAPQQHWTEREPGEDDDQ